MSLFYISRICLFIYIRDVSREKFNNAVIFVKASTTVNLFTSIDKGKCYCSSLKLRKPIEKQHVQKFSAISFLTKIGVG